MKTNQWIGRSFLHFPFAIFLLTCAAGTGCSSQHSSLTLRPAADESRVFTQAFPRAYVTRSEDGEFEAVLIDDGIDAVHDPKPGKPLESSPMTPVTQVVHIRVFWRPLPGTLADHPSATNAALDWYVISDGAERGDNLLHYSGAGFVTVGTTSTGANFKIRNASVILKEQRGQMTDPIGPARLTGVISATTNEPEVRSQMAALQQALHPEQEPSPQFSSTNSPPARSHEGP